MTDLRKAAEMAAYEVPLHELLEGVPENARLVIDSEDGMSTRFIPVGHLCKQAAKALRQALAQPDEVLAEREVCAKLCEDICLKYSKADDYAERVASQWCAEAIRARSEKRPVKSYCGGKPNYCTPEQGNSSPNYPISESSTPFVDTVNTSQERVDETEKREHEPFIYVREDNERPFGGYEHCSQADAGAFPVYISPLISDYHEGWEEGFKAAKREWVGLTDDEVIDLLPTGDWEIESTLDLAKAIEAKLKEKNT